MSKHRPRAPRKDHRLPVHEQDTNDDRLVRIASQRLRSGDVIGALRAIEAR